MSNLQSDDSGDECWYNEADEGPVNHLSKDLQDFRVTWEAELREKRMGIFRPTGGNRHNSVETESTALEKAKKLFLLGYSAERDGKLADAIEYYRHAVLIDPSIESHARDDVRAFREKFALSSVGRGCSDSNNTSRTDPSENEAAADRDSQTPNNFITPETVIYKEYDQSACHISALPHELLLYLMRWMIGNQLDVRAVEQVSMTCRALYYLARDAELWRLICIRTFGKTFDFPPELTSSCNTWRDFYIEVPHIHFNGCYISRVVYHRRGDISLDCAYQPWHSVEYYRYFRFFPDGTVLTLTTSDDPITSLPKLRNRNAKFQNVIQGVYRVAGSDVNVILEKTSSAELVRHRPNSSQQHPSVSTTLTYYMCFELRNRRYRSYLSWKSYRVVSRMTGGKESTNDFDCSSDNSGSGNQSFPALFFSRVKSFAAASDAPLA